MEISRKFFSKKFIIFSTITIYLGIGVVSVFTVFLDDQALSHAQNGIRYVLVMFPAVLFWPFGWIRV